MPVMDGLEAARRIRALDGGQSVKIAALTASASTDQRSEVLAAGMDDFVRKPYHSNEIFDCMALHLGVRYRRSETVQAAPAESSPAPPPEMLARLPDQLRNDLRLAVITLNMERIAAAIGRVSDHDPVLGALLARLFGSIFIHSDSGCNRWRNRFAQSNRA
jgi:CheY-like chemotaxis protein